MSGVNSTTQTDRLCLQIVLVYSTFSSVNRKALCSREKSIIEQKTPLTFFAIDVYLNKFGSSGIVHLVYII